MMSFANKGPPMPTQLPPEACRTRVEIRARQLAAYWVCDESKWEDFIWRAYLMLRLEDDRR